MTPAQREALEWLDRHNGDGVFMRGGAGNTLIAAGEVSPVMRSTWNALAASNLVEFYGGKNNRSRCRLTASGRRALQ